jgi:methyl-accepting chemotaxis protein
MRLFRGNIFSSAGIGTRIILVGSIGVAGMLTIGLMLLWAVAQLEDSASTVEKSHRVSERISEFSQAMNQARIRFEAFKDAPGKLTIESAESVLASAADKALKVQEESAGIIAESDLAKLLEMVTTIRDSIRQIIPEDKRSGLGSIERLHLMMQDRASILAAIRRELLNAKDRSPEAFAGLQLAGKIGDAIGIVVEAQAKPDRLLMIRLSGEVSEASGLVGKTSAEMQKAHDIGKALNQLDEAFETWINQASAMQNDTAIASTIFTIIAPLTEKMNEQNAAAAKLAQANAAMVKDKTRTMTMATLIISILLATLVAFLIGRSITRPISAIRDAMQAISGGATDRVIPHADRSNEIGSMARSVQIFQRAMQERQNLTDAQLDAATNRASRSRDLTQAVQGFDQALSGTRQSLSDSSGQLATYSVSLADISRNLDGDARATMEASAGTAYKSTSVATATEELAHSIAEISMQTERASAAVQQAVVNSNDSQERMLSLKARAAEITSIVEIINSVAAQTNLLALNATIEAARAGQAGKGFAVVAQEIKALAHQTASATADISRQIHSMQQAATEGASAVSALAGSLSLVEESSITVAAAVRQQDHSVTEIARIMAELSGEANLAQDSSSRTSARTAEARMMAESLHTLSESVEEISARFRSEAERFMTVVNAASAA